MASVKEIPESSSNECEQLDLIEFLRSYPPCDHVAPSECCLVCTNRMFEDYQEEKIRRSLKHFFVSRSRETSPSVFEEKKDGK